MVFISWYLELEINNSERVVVKKEAFCDDSSFSISWVEIFWPLYKNLISFFELYTQIYKSKGFPGGSMINNPPANVGDLG